MKRNYGFLLSVIAAIFASALQAGETENHKGTPNTSSAENTIETEQTLEITKAEDENDQWLDTSHSYVVSGADNIAVWMNQFFGDARTEEEAPYSTLRLRFEQEYDEQDQFDSDIKLRGKVYLPNLNERVSLLFADEDTGETGRDDLLIDEKDTPDDVTLQFKASEKKRSRIDFRLGLRSSLHLKSSVRYRYKHPISDSLLGTYSEELLHIDGEGFAARTRIEFDKALSEELLLQWHNRTDWREDISGFTWSSSLSLDKKLSEKKVIGSFVGASGASRRTEEGSELDNYQIGLRYRQNMFRPWLFGEVQPSYRWTTTYPDDKRESAAVILFRLEAVFHKDFSE